MGFRILGTVAIGRGAALASGFDWACEGQSHSLPAPDRPRN